ncbi:endoplasmic reticulum membrane-associated RNA degradation protein-like [Malaya genurostris]|uniref:endoplasmic reticulum membrane-associated RNA degradation protein-like n=1 Tax=Malaya genurostris TaxID=325434 RepID=UPI0026F3B172|nr:endoplasmic reticulum membrane-associated RNA degradation protein-like [Malaya genurostris]
MNMCVHIYHVTGMSVDEENECYFCDEIKQLFLIESNNRCDTSSVCSSNNNTNFWRWVEECFGDRLVYHDQPLSYEYCRSVTPAFHEFLRCCPTAVYSEQMLSWTGRLDLLSLAVGIATQDTLRSSLILTSIVEYSLGNVFQTKTGTAPPHLLRDLLMADALTSVLGENAVYLLRLLLGTPNGINLRNLVWHGFASRTDVSPLYINFLLFMLSSIGDRLEKMNFVVRHRRCAEQWGELVESIKLDHFYEVLFEGILHDISALPEVLKSNWLQAIHLYRKGEFYQCVCIALPQLEMYLRKLYGTLYDIDYRAKLNEYYIIMDTIFEEFDSMNARNKIHRHFSTPLLELVYDLFSALEGPRIRDKLSHGELKLSQVDETLANRVLCLSNLILINDKNFQYVSIFHPNAKLKLRLKECEIALDMIALIELPVESMIETEISPFLPSVGIPSRIHIFHREAKEAELVGLLTRISSVQKMAVDNLYESLTSRLDALVRRELRSRARNTLDNMVRMFPTVWQGLTLVLRIVKWIFHCLMELTELPTTTKVTRFLKFVLKYTENAAKNLNSKSNAWQPLYEATKRELYDKTRQNLPILLC